MSPRYSLDVLIDGAIDEFEDEREQEWSNDDRTKRALTTIDATAGWLLAGTEELVITSDEPPQGIDWDLALKLANSKLLSKEIRDRLQIEVARRFVGSTTKMAERCLDLARLVMKERPGKTVLPFLRRLARCYVSGFHAECIMLCRAVVENAVVDKFAREKIPLPATPEGRSPMTIRFRAARMLGWMSDRTVNAAETVWHRGSKAVHHDPHATVQILETIQMTMGVLERLYE